MTVEVPPVEAGRIVVDGGIGGMALKQLVEADEPTVHDLVFYDTEHFLRADEPIPERIDTPKKLHEWVTASSEEDRCTHNTKFGMWVTDTMVGCAGFRRNSYRLATLWYFVGAQYVGNRYAATAMHSIKQYLYRDGATTLELFIRPKNLASIRTAHMAGFSRFQKWDYDFDRYVATKPGSRVQ